MTTHPSHPWSGLLSRYFRSGWAMLLPYLGLYLVHAACRLPVAGLLAIYWVLHGIHAVAAGWLVWSQHTARASTPGAPAAGTRLLPWVLLALLFLLPGLYLEYPADPWEHLRRINEWSSHPDIRDHSHWFKAGYFLPYSLFGWMAGSALALPAATVYVAAVSLLLSWQYYRLARAIGLAPATAFAFVLLEAMLAGNNLFSFHRYYGLSTTIYAQIAAVAIIRIAVEQRGRWWNDLRSVGAIGALALVAACNHIQGLAIAAAGVVAISLHALWMQRRRACLLVFGLVAAGSVAVVCAGPRPPALAAVWEAGWLTKLGGFALLPDGSAPAHRVGAILGWAGIFNLGCGVVLLVRNRLAGWLTVFPVAALCIPLIAVPIAYYATRSGGAANIVVLPRLLFAIPAGLAVAALAEEIAATRWRFVLAPAGLAALAAALVISPSSPAYNRFWHSLARPPADLALQAPYANFQAARPEARPGGLVATTSRLDFVLQTLRPVPGVYSPYYYRGYFSGGLTTGGDFSFLDRVLANPGRQRQSLVITASPFLLVTPRSQAGTLSGHWLPQEVALAYAGMPELARAAGPAPSGDVRYHPNRPDERAR